MGLKRRRVDFQSPPDEAVRFFKIPKLSLQDAQHMQRVELILVVRKDRLVESLRFRKVAGLMR